ncbi:hypothetical protein GWI33_019363 [Rhynchophorus ferrugineus]|uniref:Uncharacterized protein n=1 Tax=Rhynchophorus ferrugineus TaxID=354439 RepID=A0A834M747_RHYFE|nr:hypothetical protein GWI33_019363 [Rhynchophorus ferrugineus]
MYPVDLEPFKAEEQAVELDLEPVSDFASPNSHPEANAKPRAGERPISENNLVTWKPPLSQSSIVAPDVRNPPSNQISDYSRIRGRSGGRYLNGI